MPQHEDDVQHFSALSSSLLKGNVKLQPPPPFTEFIPNENLTFISAEFVGVKFYWG